MRQKGIALAYLVLIVAGIVIISLLSGKVNIRTKTGEPQPVESNPSPSAAPTISPSPFPSPSSISTPRTRRTSPEPTETRKISDTAEATATETPTPTPIPQPTGDNTTSSNPFKLPLPKLTTLPIPTEKNLVPLASSFGASSTYGPGYEAQKAFDGSTSTRWSAAKNAYYGSVWIEWPTEKTITSIGWTALPSKYGAPKDFRVECGENPPVDSRPLTYSRLDVSQESQWSDNSPKDMGVRPVKARWCSIFISSVQNQTYAATLTEIQVKGY